MKLKFLTLTVLTLVLFACQTDSIDDSLESTSAINVEALNPRFIETPMDNFKLDLSNNNNSSFKSSSSIEQFMTTVNTELQNQGLSLQLNTIEYYNLDGAGNTVFFNNRGNKQLDADFVPGDTRRGGNMDIAYVLDGVEGVTASGLTQSDTDDAILSAMNTWDNVTCSEGLELTNLGIIPIDIGYVQALVGQGGLLAFTDIMHSGFSTGLFDIIFGVGSNVLGVTFTFIFTDGTNPTDIDNNGKDDVAFRDIYYNNAFSWAVGANIDVETVALHEAGHGLSQGHFGKLFLSGGDSNSKFHFAPRAVMNAGYTGVQTSIDKTDNAGHCSIWDEWPNN